MNGPLDKTRRMSVKSFHLYNNRGAQVPNAIAVSKLLYSLINDTN